MAIGKTEKIYETSERTRETLIKSDFQEQLTCYHQKGLTANFHIQWRVGLNETCEQFTTLSKGKMEKNGGKITGINW